MRKITGKKLNEMLKEERERQGMTRKELAEKAGVTDRAVTYWESGKWHMNLESADRVFRVLGMCVTIGLQPAAGLQNNEPSDNT